MATSATIEPLRRSPHEDGSNVRNFFRRKTHRVFGMGELGDFISGLSHSTRASCETAWGNRRQFTGRIPERRWIREIGVKWEWAPYQLDLVRNPGSGFTRNRCALYGVGGPILAHPCRLPGF